MATNYTAFARHRLVNEATLQSQNISANTSVVTGKLFLQSMDAYGAISAGAQGRVAIKINGVTKSSTANSTVSANQKKLLFAADYTVGHDEGGKSSPAVYGEYNVNVTFAGVYYGVVKVNSNGTDWGMGALPTIPRHSSLNAISAFTVPNGCSISISRKSTFTHNLSFWIQNRTSPTLSNDAHWTWIMDISNIATSGTFNFSQANMKTIAGRLNQFGGAMQGKVKLWTNGVSGLSAQRTVQINSPSAATPNPSDITLKAGNNLSCTLSNKQSSTRFTYDFRLDCAGWSKTWSNQTANLSYNLTQDDVNQMQSRFVSATSNGAKFTITSKLDGVQYRATTEKYFVVYVDTSLSSPLVSASFTHVDSNPISVNVTKNDKIMLQNVSNLKVTVPSSVLTARGYGTLKTVEVSFGGITTTLNYASGNMVFDLGTVKTAINGALTVKVTDSRGLTGNNSYAVIVYPYQFPVIDATVMRQNNFESEVWIKGSIPYSLIPGTDYQIKSLTYRINNGPEEFLGSSMLEAGLIYITPTNFNLDTALTATVIISVTDDVGTISRSFSLGKGKPIVFINSYNESVAIGNLTGTSYNGTLPGMLELEAERYHTTGKTGLQMNNSDMSGVNGIWFSTDVSNNEGEGLHFIRSGAEANVTVADFYDYMYMRDGGFYVNNNSQPLFTVSEDGLNMPFNTNGWLWSGGNWPNANQTITPSKKLTDCRNGWMLTWSLYNNGTQDTDIVFSPVHKGTLKHGNTYRRFALPNTNNTVSQKALTIYDTYLTGSRDNSQATYDNNKVVLRAVFEF